MISGLDAPSLNEHAFCPAELRGELLGKFPTIVHAARARHLMGAGKVDDSIAAGLKLTETQTSAAEYLIEARPPISSDGVHGQRLGWSQSCARVNRVGEADPCLRGLSRA